MGGELLRVFKAMIERFGGYKGIQRLGEVRQASTVDVPNGRVGSRATIPCVHLFCSSFFSITFFSSNL